MRRSTISSASSGLEYLSSNVDQTDRTRWAEARRAELYSCSDIDVEGTDDADDEGGWTRRRFCGDLSIEIIFGARSFEDAQSEGNWEMVEPRSCLKVYAVVHTSRHRYRCWFVQVAFSTIRDLAPLAPKGEWSVRAVHMAIVAAA